MAEPARPLRRRDFRQLWIGYGLSALGSQFTQLALPLLVLDATGSPTAAGLVGTLRLLVFTVTQLPGGAIADRFTRRTLLLAVDAGRAAALLTVGLLVLGDRDLPVAVLVAVIAIEGLLTSMAGAAASAAAPHVVERDEMGAALALNQAQSYAIRLVGPLLGGVLYEWYAPAPFLLDALSYTLSLGFILTVRRPLGGGGDRSRRGNLVTDIAEGVRYVFGSRYLVLLMSWAALANFATAGIGFAMVLAVGSGNGRELGVATAVVSLAGLSGALAARRLPPDVPPRLAPATAGMVALGVVAAVLPGPVTLTLAMAGIALLSPLVSVPLNTGVYALVPDELMGRVQSSLFMIGGSIYPFAALTAGYLTERVSLGVATGAFAAILGAVLVLIMLPVFQLPRPGSPTGASAAGRPDAPDPAAGRTPVAVRD